MTADEAIVNALAQVDRIRAEKTTEFLARVFSMPGTVDLDAVHAAITDSDNAWAVRCGQLAALLRRELGLPDSH